MSLHDLLTDRRLDARQVAANMANQDIFDGCLGTHIRVEEGQMTRSIQLFITQPTHDRTCLGPAAL